MLLLACNICFAQVHHYSFAHDSAGHRVSRVYQGTTRGSGVSATRDSIADGCAEANVVQALSAVTGRNSSGVIQAEHDSVISTERSEWRDLNGLHGKADTKASVSDKDTARRGPLVKTAAQKAAYLDSMLAEAVALDPFAAPAAARTQGDNDPYFSVGAIPLEYGVSGSGARTYNVPIYTAPDIGYAPSLSLVYNSQGGYGYGGYGWDLAGLSTITLVAESPYWDDNIEAASSSDYDGVFCLDGVRLVTNTHSTTKNAFPLVTATGERILVAPIRGDSDFITSFTVLYPDGSRATFGSGTDLGFTLPSYPMVSSSSLEGDRIEYHYSLENTDGNHSLDSISYGFDATGAAAAVLRFSSTPSPVYNYYAGRKARRAPIVSQIESVSAGVALYTYTLTYESAAGATLLSSIDLANLAGEQLPPLQFSYGADVTPHSGQDSLKLVKTLPLSYILSPGDSAFVLRRGKFVSGSYNDGLVAYRGEATYSEGDIGEYYYSYPANTSYAFAASITDHDSAVPMNTGISFLTAEAADTDGDGVDELIRICGAPVAGSPLASPIYIDIYRCNSYGNPVLSANHTVSLPGHIDTGDYISPCRHTFRWGDFTGGGKVQLLATTYCDNGFGQSQTPYITLIDLDTGFILYQVQFSPLQITPSTDGRLLCMDIDGDSRTEMCIATTNGLTVYQWNGSYFDCIATHAAITQSLVDSGAAFWADINADGYIDLLQAPAVGSSSSSWTAWLNTGNSFAPTQLAICPRSSGEAFMFMDIDRDGFPDLMQLSQQAIGHYPNLDGMSFGSWSDSHLHAFAFGQMLPPNVVDYTAMSSFVTIDDKKVHEYAYTSYSHPARHLVQSVDSFGKTIVSSYGYLPQSSLLWTEEPSDIDASAGYQLRVLPLYVLTGERGFLSAADTSQVFLSGSYSWWDGVVHTRGLGFCGFSKMRAASVLDGITTVSVSRYNPQKKGVPVSRAQFLGSEATVPFHRTDYTFDDYATTYGKMDPRLTETEQTDNVTGVVSQTHYNYDVYNYPTSVWTQSSCSIGDSTVVNTTSTSTSYVHHNQPQRYILGSAAWQFTASDRDGDGVLDLGTRTVYYRDSLSRPARQKVYRSKAYAPWDVQFALISTTCWTYDAHGNVTREESAPAGSEIFIGRSYTYDASGRHLSSSTDELGLTTTYSGFDTFGNPALVTNHKGQQTHIFRDGWGRTTRTVHPDGTIDSLARSWSSVGAYTETTTSSGKPDASVCYDALGREVLSSNKRFDGQWQKVRTYYNQRGLVVRHSQPYRGSSEPSIYGWQWVYYDYDSLSRPVKSREASGRQTTWSYSGVSVTEVADGVSTTRTASPDGLLMSVSDASGTIRYSYRDDGQPMSVVREGSNAAVTFTYDALGRRTSITDPSAGVRTTAYVQNSDGSSIVTETNALGSVVSTHDRYGRLASTVRPDFSTAYAYDTLGRLTSVISTNSTSSHYTYDAYDRPLTVRDSVPDGMWLQKHYYYGSDGNVSYLSLSGSDGLSAMEAYSYANGTLTQTYLIHPTTTVVYNLTAENDFGQPTSATSGSVTRTYSYTDYGKPAYRKMGGIMDQRTSFNEATGNLTSRLRISGNSYLSESFSYDALNRLTGAGSSTLYYDNDHNMVSNSAVGTMAYAGGAHPYTITGLDAFSTVAVGTASQYVTYTAYDRPAEITQGNTHAGFVYDAQGRRAQMVTTVDGYTDRVNYYMADRYEIQWDDESGSDTQLLWLGGDAYSAPMVLRKTSFTSWTPYVIGRDYLGSITHIATTSGTLVAEYSYDAWGRLRDPATNAVYDAASQPALLLGRGWCGHEHLPAFGLINMNARLYDPILGRFLSPDPYIQALDLPASFNRYSYCLNNPLKYTDESGEFVLTTMLIVGGISATIFGLGNLASHAIRKDDLGHGKWAEFFFSGALAGFAVGSLGYAGISGMVSLAKLSGFWGVIGRKMLWSSVGMAKINAYATAASIAGGTITHGWQGLANAGKIILGNFYLDENKSFWGQVGEGILRHTWEYPQQTAGYFWSSIRNCWADRVDYMAGATFVTNEYAGNGPGVSLGNYSNIDIIDSIGSTDFEDFATHHGIYMHEYGHIIDSKHYGLSYLFAVGIPSVISAKNNKCIPGKPVGTHRYKPYEMRANQNASIYFWDHYGIDWSPYEPYYPTKL